jgi:hypothetical protein
MSDHVQIKLALPDGSWLSLLQGPGTGGNATEKNVEVAWVKPRPDGTNDVEDPVYRCDAFELSVLTQTILRAIKHAGGNHDH